MFLFRVAFGLIRLMFRFSLALVILAAAGLVLYTTFWLPDVSPLVSSNPETTSFMESARERHRREGSRVVIRQEWVDLDRISKHLVNAVLVAEDDRFYQHQGFDFTEIQNALEENRDAGRYVRGGSTLSQQLAKNLYLSPDKTLRRKFDEMLLTWKLEHTLDKNRILELYLNVIEWGGGTYGIGAASQYYFSKPASMLTEKESATLAARIPNPDGMSVQKRIQRENLILARMRKKGSQDRREEIEVVRTAPSPDSSGSNGVLDVVSKGWMESATEAGAGLKSRLESILARISGGEADERAASTKYQPVPARSEPSSPPIPVTAKPSVKPPVSAQPVKPAPAAGVRGQPAPGPVPSVPRTVVSGLEAPAAQAVGAAVAETAKPETGSNPAAAEGWTLPVVDLQPMASEDLAGTDVETSAQDPSSSSVTDSQTVAAPPVAPVRAERKPTNSNRIREAILRLEKVIED